MMNAAKYFANLAKAGDAAKAYTDQRISSLVNGAPAALDTLNELSAALNKDPNFATSMTNLINTKVSKSGDTITGTLTITGALNIPTSDNGNGNLWVG